MSDEKAVGLLDELMYQLKSANGPVALALRKTLSEFCKNNGLDSDPHCFASMPEEAR